MACLAVSVTLGLVACGDDGSRTTVIGDAKPAIEYNVSGGIAGISEHLTIFSDRKATLASGYGPDRSTARFDVTDAEFANLRDKLDAARLDSLPKPGPTGCADCFEYRVSYQGIEYSADDVSLPDRLGPTIAALNAIIAAHGKDAGASVLGGK